MDNSMKKNLGTLYGIAAMAGALGMSAGPRAYKREESPLNDRRLYEGKGFSGGEQPLRPFVIKGVTIMATDKKMAQKKYRSGL